MSAIQGRLPRSFFARDTRVVARALLGKWLVVGEKRGRIVETEAYHGPNDAAAHVRFGKTARTAPLFGPAGVSYVYLVYGMWHCMNVVTMRDGFGAAVLLRAVAIDGEPASVGRGPGKLCVALGIDRRLNALDCTEASAPLWFANDDGPGRGRIASGPRVGIDYADEAVSWPWRYWWRDHPAVSKAR